MDRSQICVSIKIACRACVCLACVCMRVSCMCMCYMQRLIQDSQRGMSVLGGRIRFLVAISEKSDVLLRIRLVSSIFLAHAILTIAASNLQLWVSSWSTSLF